VSRGDRPSPVHTSLSPWTRSSTLVHTSPRPCTVRRRPCTPERGRAQGTRCARQGAGVHGHLPRIV